MSRSFAPQQIAWLGGGSCCFVRGLATRSTIHVAISMGGVAAAIICLRGTGAVSHVRL